MAQGTGTEMTTKLTNQPNQQIINYQTKQKQNKDNFWNYSFFFDL